MNEEQFKKFIENVKANKVPGLFIDEFQHHSTLDEVDGEWAYVDEIHDDGKLKAWCCAAIRRALSKMGWRRNLSDDRLAIVRNVAIRTMLIHFREGTEIDWHIAAINYAVEQTKGEQA